MACPAIHNGMGGAIGGGGGGGGGGEGGKVDEGEERCVVVRCIRIYEVSSSPRSRHLAAQRWQRRAIASESLKVKTPGCSAAAATVVSAAARATMHAD